MRDCNDWQITAQLLLTLDRLWGKHTINCFVSHYNKKAERYFSRFWNPDCGGVNASFQPWTNGNCLLNCSASIPSNPRIELCEFTESYRNVDSTSLAFGSILA